MEIETRLICGACMEVTITDTNVRIESGLLDDREALEYADKLREAADNLERFASVETDLDRLIYALQSIRDCPSQEVIEEQLEEVRNLI